MHEQKELRDRHIQVGQLVQAVFEVGMKLLTVTTVCFYLMSLAIKYTSGTHYNKKKDLMDCRDYSLIHSLCINCKKLNWRLS